MNTNTTKHTPATLLPQIGFDIEGFFMRFPDAKSAYAVQSAVADRAKLIEMLTEITDSHAELENQRGSTRATHTANALALLRELEGQRTQEDMKEPA